MITKLQISEKDKESIKGLSCQKDSSIEKMDFLNLVVNKPWGYEYLMFQTPEVSIWMLHIKKGYSTSVHCHPNKKTSLLVVSGKAISSSLNETFNLNEKEGVIYDKGVFHTTEAISENGAFVMEIETPSDKTDLIRLKDNYKREKKAYTSRQNITNKTYNYHYQYIEDKESETKIFGKYKFLLRNFKDNDELLKNLELFDSEIGILISGEIQLNERLITLGDIFLISDLKKANIYYPIKILIMHERKNLIKSSDYIISLLEKNGIEKAFLCSGEKIMHLLESLRNNGKIDYLFTHHEQSATMAAESFSKITNKIGLVMVTGGSGATNAITGVAGAWVDSIPIIIISGQAFNNQTVGNSGLRQLGVQEINIVKMVRPITKYAVMIKDTKKLKYHIEKALYLATSGRPGPVWLDIPINIHMEMIEKQGLDSFIPKKIINNTLDLDNKIQEAINLIKNAKRPIILLGNGVRLGKAEKEFFLLAEKLNIPIVTSRNANDLIYDSHPLYVGRIGSFGQRYANFAVQNSDLLLSIGSRIGYAVTGWTHDDFAREAKKIIIDIDARELKKPTIKSDILINCDSKEFISKMLDNLTDYNSPDISSWKEKIQHWKNKYPIVLPEYREEKDFVNPYYFTEVLSEELDKNDIIVTDTGMSFHCIMQAFKLKEGQRLFSSSGLATAGYGLPGAIGASIGNNKKRVICIAGDGGLMKTLQELQTIKHNALPIKIFIFNNKGYAYMKQLQKNYFQKYMGSESSSGLSIPDIIPIGESFGIKTKKIINQENLRENIREVINYQGPIICDINISDKQEIIPKQGIFNRPDGKTVPRPIEDMFPYLDREEFEKEMIIEPIPFDPYKE